MSRILIGRKKIQEAFGDVGWSRVMRYISLGAPIYKGEKDRDPYESDFYLLMNWWKKHIESKARG